MKNENHFGVKNQNLKLSLKFHFHFHFHFHSIHVQVTFRLVHRKSEKMKGVQILW